MPGTVAKATQRDLVLENQKPKNQTKYACVCVCVCTFLKF